VISGHRVWFDLYIVVLIILHIRRILSFYCIYVKRGYLGPVTINKWDD
jgi:hypothetical protein